MCLFTLWEQVNKIYIFATLSEKKHCTFRNCKNHISQNVFAVYFFDIDFLYVMAGWEKTAYNTSVFQHAVYKKRFFVSLDKYHFVDAGYSNCNIVLAPYQNVQYHLKE